MVLVVKNLLANAGEVREAGSVLGWEDSPGEGNGNPLLYSCLEDPMDSGAWQATVQGITKMGTTEATARRPPLVVWLETGLKFNL